jgi:CPA1 family monovalent cation:H+ antiporter
VSIAASNVEAVVWLLLIATAVALLCRYTPVPYTIALVCSGLVLAQVKFISLPELNSDVVLLVFLPALLFESAFKMHLESLRGLARPVSVLALPGVIVTVATIALALHRLNVLPLATAFVFGAIVSATDPIAVLAIFNRLGVPIRLATLVEAESLFNDGTALVIFGIAVGVSASASFSLDAAVVRFLVVVAGGAAIGAALAFVASHITATIDDHLVETVLSTVLAYGAYLVAERLHVSGVIAVVVAGLVLGNYGSRIGMSENTRARLSDIWEYVAYVINSLVFLLIGLRIQLVPILMSWQPLLLTIAAVVLARILVVYGTSGLAALFRRKVPWAWQHLLVWGGLRGALSISMVLSLPDTFAAKDTLLRLTFGVVLFTVLVFGTTIQPLVRALHLRPIV